MYCGMYWYALTWYDMVLQYVLACITFGIDCMHWYVLVCIRRSYVQVLICID